MERTHKAYLVEEYSLGKIKNWKLIDNAKKSYLIHDNPSINLIRFPGLVFNKVSNAAFYEAYYDTLKCFTPPRGNLANNIIFVGIKPGNYQLKMLNNNDVSESAWLLGPSSKLLNVVLQRLNIYPYFTNVYKTHDQEENGDISDIITELSFISMFHDKLKIIFMGGYKEYDEIIKKISPTFECHRIWHPSYILRTGKKNLNTWICNIQKCLQEK